MQSTASSEVSLTPSVSEVSPREISPHNSSKNPSLIHLGKHLLAEFFDCNSNVLNNPGLIEELMEKAAVLCGATVIQKNFHLFSPYGVSGVVIIAESHLAIHTWPEYGYAAVDLFTCGDSCKPEIAYDYLRNEFHAASAYYSELNRGHFNPETQRMIQTPFEVKLEINNSDNRNSQAPHPVAGEP